MSTRDFNKRVYIFQSDLQWDDVLVSSMHQLKFLSYRLKEEEEERICGRQSRFNYWQTCISFIASNVPIHANALHTSSLPYTAFTIPLDSLIPQIWLEPRRPIPTSSAPTQQHRPSLALGDLSFNAEDATSEPCDSAPSQSAFRPENMI
jgi:hypothetical protein